MSPKGRLVLVTDYLLQVTMLIDTHCHVNFNAFKEDAQEVIQRSRESGISLIAVGTQIDTSRSAVELAEQYENVYATVGLHPVHLYSQYIDEEETSFRTREETFDVDVYRELAQHEKVVAIGEVGLDYFRFGGVEDVEAVKRLQRETFEQVLSLVSDIGKPIIIHTRPSPDTYDAYDDVLSIVGNWHACSVQGVVHCFGGSLEQAKSLVDLGFYVGVTGIVTFKKSEVLQEIVREVSLERLLIETDAPYLSPEPYRGKRNEPAYVECVARKIADLRGISYDEVATQTTENAKALFGI